MYIYSTVCEGRLNYQIYRELYTYFDNDMYTVYMGKTVYGCVVMCVKVYRLKYHSTYFDYDLYTVVVCLHLKI